MSISHLAALLALPKAGGRPSFIWPLRIARGPSAQGADRLVNFVDHDASYPNNLRDYNCGERTYETEGGYNHRGIDISIWPDNWNDRVITATAPPVFSTCSEGRMATPGTLNEKTDFSPGQVAYFVGFVRDLPQGATPMLTIRRPDGSAWKTYTAVPASNFASGGLNVAHQGDTIFATWFTDGASGRGQWLVGSELRREATGENGRFDYTVDGVTQSKGITRQQFGTTRPLRRS